MAASTLVLCRGATDAESIRHRTRSRSWLECSGAAGWCSTTLCESAGSHHAGITLSDSEIQRQVITVAKKTEQRAWLAEVSSVALV